MSQSLQYVARPSDFTARVLLALLSSLALLPFQASASPDAESIVLVSTKGDVNITMAGKPQAVQAGGTLALPAAIRTGHDGSADLRQGETTIGVGPDSQLDFPAPAQSSELIDRVVQPIGNAFYKVAPRGSNRLRVETPYLVAVIKGTQFNVAVEQDSSTITLFEGRLEVLAPDINAAVELNAGEVAIRHRNDTEIQVIQLKDRPTPSADPKGANGAAAATGLTGSGGKTPELPHEASPLDDEVEVVLEGSSPGAAIEAADGAVSVGVSGVLGSTLEAAVDLGSGSIGASLDAGVDLGPIDAGLGVDVAADLSAGTIDAGVDAGVLGADVGVDIGVDLSGADAGIDLGLDILGTEIDLGLGGSPAPDAPATGGNAGGLLGGILRRGP